MPVSDAPVGAERSRSEAASLDNVRGIDAVQVSGTLELGLDLGNLVRTCSKSNFESKKEEFSGGMNCRRERDEERGREAGGRGRGVANRPTQKALRENALAKRWGAEATRAMEGVDLAAFATHQSWH